MSTVRNSLFPLIIISLFLSLALPSCSSDDTFTDRRRELLAYAGDDAMIIIAADPSVIINSAGAEVKNNRIAPSDKLKQLVADGKISSILKELADIRGIDLHNSVLIFSNNRIRAAFCLTDPGDFSEWITAKGFTESKEDGRTVFTNNSDAIFVKGDIAVLADKSCDDNGEIAANPVKPWLADALCGSGINMAINIDAFTAAASDIYSSAGIGALSSLNDLYNPECKYVLSDISFDGPSIHIEGKSYDGEGRQTDMLPQGTYEPLSKQMLTLLKDYELSFAFSISDAYRHALAGIFEIAGEISPASAAQAGPAAETFDALKSLGMGVSLKEGANILNFSPSDLSAVLACRYDRGKIAGCINAFKNAVHGADISKSANAVISGGTFAFSPLTQYPDFRLYAGGCADEFVIISTDSTTVSGISGAAEVTDGTVAVFNLDLPATHPLARLAAMPFGISADGVSYTDSYSCDFRLTDCEGGFIYNLISYFSKL